MRMPRDVYVVADNMGRCRGCKKWDDLRHGYCFDCASEGDLRLGRRSVLQHLVKAIGHAARGYWWNAKIDVKCAWERLTRTGEYAPGREWENL